MDIVDFCQVISLLIVVMWFSWSSSRQSFHALVCVILANAFLTGFSMRMDREGVTWHQLLLHKVDGDIVSTLLVSGAMYVALIAMFVVAFAAFVAPDIAALVDGQTARGKRRG